MDATQTEQFRSRVQSTNRGLDTMSQLYSAVVEMLAVFHPETTDQHIAASYANVIRNLAEMHFPELREVA